MSRKFVGKLIRIMMTKSSSCDILKKKRTIRRGSGSRPKGPYLMDLRFWNYVIPDGSTTLRMGAGLHRKVLELCHSRWFYYLYPAVDVMQEVLELCHSRWFYYPAGRSLPALRGFGTMSFQMVLLHAQFGCSVKAGFGTMSFQMVLLLRNAIARATIGFGTMSFQMVLLLISSAALPDDGFGTMSFQMVLLRK